MDGSEIFRDTKPIMFEEYNITPLILSRMNDLQLKRVIMEKMVAKLKREAGGDQPEKADEDLLILDKCFDSLYTYLQN